MDRDHFRPAACPPGVGDLHPPGSIAARIRRCHAAKHRKAIHVEGTAAAAAGAILAMLADTMIPEAFEQTHDAAGLITVAGFLASFALSKLGG